MTNNGLYHEYKSSLKTRQLETLFGRTLCAELKLGIPEDENVDKLLRWAIKMIYIHTVILAGFPTGRI